MRDLLKNFMSVLNSGKKDDSSIKELDSKYSVCWDLITVNTDSLMEEGRRVSVYLYFSRVCLHFLTFLDRARSSDGLDKEYGLRMLAGILDGLTILTKISGLDKNSVRLVAFFDLQDCEDTLRTLSVDECVVALWHMLVINESLLPWVIMDTEENPADWQQVRHNIYILYNCFVILVLLLGYSYDEVCTALFERVKKQGEADE